MGKILGRPKILSREVIINIAYNEYWAKGIFNVPLSTIASLANVSRAGIYKEFQDEDGLKVAVLNIKFFLSLIATLISFAFSEIAKYPMFFPPIETFFMVVNKNWL